MRRALRWIRRAALAAVAAMMLVVGGAASAMADPPYATEATLSSVSFEASEVSTGSYAQISANWSLPDRATTPAGLVMDLPAELQGRPAGFPVLDQNGVEMGSCEVSNTQITCDLDSAYLAANPLNVHGSFTFWVKVTTTVTEETTVTYRFGEVTATTTVRPAAPSTCGADCGFTGMTESKWGAYQALHQVTNWIVQVPAPVTGMAAGELVTIVEMGGPHQDLAAGSYTVLTSELGGAGNLRPWVEIAPEQVGLSITETAEGTQVKFTAEEGKFYRLRVSYPVTDEGASAVYSNKATVTVGGSVTRSLSSEAANLGGSASGTGTNVGRFAVTKAVEWGATEPVAGEVFTGSYTVTHPDTSSETGDFTVTDGQTWTSPTFPRGSTVTLVEVTPTGPESIAWGAPTFSDNDFALAGGQTTPVTLTNTATPVTGTFTAAKILTGSGVDLVADDATFTLTYSYPAGPGFAAGSGSLVLPADGTVVTSPELPLGAVVSVAESAPADVDGATWAPAVLSADSIAITGGETVAVTVTNELEALLPAIEEPETTTVPQVEEPATTVPQEEEAGVLAMTGADAWPGVVLAGLVLIAAGGSLIAAKRGLQR
ncbi:MAG: DUF5979 domain-containing protein [Propioniciclava sp.]